MAEYNIANSIRTDKPVKRNGKYPIHLRVRVKDKETKLTTNLEIEKERWDFKKHAPKDKALLIQLNKKKQDLELHINRALADGQELTIDLVKDFYSGKRKVKPESQSFYIYYLGFVERKRKEGLTPETIRVYMTTYNMLKEFKLEFKISDLNLSFIEDFDDFMRDERGNANGGRNPKHKNLRTVILDMIKHDISIKNPYLWFKIPQANTKEIYLERAELEQLRKLRAKLGHDSTMYKVLQMYLFACYCGLRFSDVNDLKWNHIDFENNLIKKTMIKTKTEVITPLFRMARAVVLELSDSKKLIGSNKNVFHGFKEPTVNKALVKLTKMADIDKHITYHSSRHTFATLLVIEGVDIYKIKQYLGHKSVTMTERYLKYDLSIAKESVKEIKTFG
ncbi:MAG: site-specific integrase [Holosporales bacterium]|jgi:integrase|nr:site-specific integrase [Holosporales bacterium]